MRPQEFRELPDAELSVRLGEVKEELFNLRFQNATGQLENYSRLTALKKDVARIETLLKERALGIESSLQETSEVKKRRWSGAPGPSQAPAEEEPEPEEEPKAKKKSEAKDEDVEETAEAEVSGGEEE